jgi:hypothetical protein
MVSIRQASATASATEATRIAMRTVFLGLRWRGPCLLNNSIYLLRSQALVPIGSFHCFFYFCKAFAGSGEIGEEVSHPYYT